MNLEFTKNFIEKLDNLYLHGKKDYVIIDDIKKDIDHLKDKGFNVFQDLYQKLTDSESTLEFNFYIDKLYFAINKIDRKLKKVIEERNTVDLNDNILQNPSYKIRKYIFRNIESENYDVIKKIIPKLIFEDNFRGLISNQILKYKELQQEVAKLKPSNVLDKFHVNILNYRLNSTDFEIGKSEVSEMVSYLFENEKEYNSKFDISDYLSKKTNRKHLSIALIGSPLQERFLDYFDIGRFSTNFIKTMKYLDEELVWKKISRFFTPQFFDQLLYFKKVTDLLDLVKYYPNKSVMNIIHTALSNPKLSDSRELQLIITLGNYGDIDHFPILLKSYNKYLDRALNSRYFKKSTLKKIEDTFSNFGIKAFPHIREIYDQAEENSNITKMQSLRNIIENLNDHEKLDEIKSNEKQENIAIRAYKKLNDKLSRISSLKEIKKVITKEKDYQEFLNLLKKNELNHLAVKKLIRYIYKKSVVKELSKEKRIEILESVYPSFKNDSGQGEIDKKHVTRIIKIMNEGYYELLSYLVLETIHRIGGYYWWGFAANLINSKEYSKTFEILRKTLIQQLNQRPKIVTQNMINVFGAEPDDEVIKAMIDNYHKVNSRSQREILDKVSRYCRENYLKEGVKFLNKEGQDWHKRNLLTNRFQKPAKYGWQNQNSNKINKYIKWILIASIIAVYILIRVLTNDLNNSPTINEREIRPSIRFNFSITITPPALEIDDWEEIEQSVRPGTNSTTE